jgi:hypothetical protein
MFPIRLSEKHIKNLFGDDNADAEDESRFRSYAIQTEEYESLEDPDTRLGFVSAYKGMGKSAILRLLEIRLKEQSEPPLVIRTKAEDLLPKVFPQGTLGWTRDWKRSIVNRIAAEVGATIGMAWTDDSTSLVELSEKDGFKRRNIIGYILDRMGLKLSATAKDFGLDTVSAEIKRQVVIPENVEPILRRWMAGNKPIWFIIDDSDKNFNGSTSDGDRTIALLDACKSVASEIPQIVIRTSIRPNVWTSLSSEYETPANLRQYLLPLRWSENDTRSMLARRIYSFLERKDLAPALDPSRYKDQLELIAMLFDAPMECMGISRPPHVSLHTFSMHRPRWVIGLSKAAARRALQAGSSKIRQEDINHCLAEFGGDRIQDLIAEYRTACSEIGNIIDAFHGAEEDLETADLFKLIDNRILSQVSPKMPAVKEPKNRDIAHFLFQIGFYFGRKELPNGEYKHITYDDDPRLLASVVAVDKGLRWEIHPMFRQMLGMRDQTGRRVRR